MANKNLDKLIKELEMPKANCDPHEVAKVISGLCRKSDYSGMRKLEEAYINYCTKYRTKRLSLDKAKSIVRPNLYMAGVVADLVKTDGYEASYQLLVANPYENHPGKVADFVKKAIHYNPKKYKE